MQAKTILTTAAGWISRRQACAAFSLLPLEARTRSRLFSSSLSSKAGVDASADSATSENEPEITKERTGATALIFDTETTGMVRFRNPYTDPSQPDLVQLGFLMVDTSDWKIRNQGSFLVQLRNSTVGIDEGAQRVHGISEQDCSDFGIQHETVLDVFENLCSSADVIVGHNIRFDAIVMKTAFFRGRSSDNSYSEVLSSKRQICTMMESIDLCKLPPKSFKSKSSSKSNPYKWPSLEEAYKFVTGGDRGESGETLEGAHDALVDSEACMKVFRYLVEHGHVSVEKEIPAKSPDLIASEANTAGEPTTPIATLPVIELPVVSSDASVTTATPATEPLFEDANDGFDSNPEEMHNYKTPERNGGADRSKEIEEAATYGSNAAKNNESIDLSTEAGKTAEGSPRPFDPSSFSSDMLETGSVINKNKNSSGPSPSDSDSANTEKGGFRVRGNTYEHKEMIKQLGGRWNGQLKEWVFHESQYLSKLESYEDLTIERFSDE